MEDKKVDTEVLENLDEVTSKKTEELKEVVSLLQIEKEDLKKRKGELVLLLEEIKKERSKFFEETEKKYTSKEELEDKEEEETEINHKDEEPENEENETKNVELEDININFERKRTPVKIESEKASAYSSRQREDEIKNQSLGEFEEMCLSLEIRDFEIEFGDKDSTILPLKENIYLATNREKILMFQKFSKNNKNETILLKSQNLGKLKNLKFHI